MFTHAVRTLRLTLLVVLLISPVAAAFATTPGSAANPPTTTTASSSPTSGGITGTDPEPTDPGDLSTLLAILGLG